MTGAGRRTTTTELAIEPDFDSVGLSWSYRLIVHAEQCATTARLDESVVARFLCGVLHGEFPEHDSGMPITVEIVRSEVKPGTDAAECATTLFFEATSIVGHAVARGARIHVDLMSCLPLSRERARRAACHYFAPRNLSIAYLPPDWRE